ncbi:MAG: GNAT family N-acetyltransferase [Bacteroidota bacterium]
MSITISPITPEDNPIIATIIRKTLEEFNANKCGTVYYDASTDHLFELFSKERSGYFIARSGNTIVGGGGFFPSDGLPEDTCELVKMYLLPEARGIGTGAQLILKAMEGARAAGFKRMYIETMPELQKAMSVYEKFGFAYLDGPMGNTGHHGCSIWMCGNL